MKSHVLPCGTIWEGNFLEAPLEPGYTLAILDGAYGLQKAAWDRVSLDNLPDWYRPHLERVTGLLAASASLYVWNTAPGLKRLDPVIRALGWTWRADITWDKVITPAMLRESLWPDVTEVCGVYIRGAPVENGSREHERTNARGTPCWISNVWRMSAVDPAWRSARLRGEIEKGKTAVDKDRESPLHPCEKPLLFAERMIRASSRPGDRVLVPFGGTCREAVVCEWLVRTEPAEARRYDVVELNQDGPDYIGAALAQIRGEDPRQKAAGQMGLFR